MTRWIADGSARTATTEEEDIRVGSLSAAHLNDQRLPDGRGHVGLSLHNLVIGALVVMLSRLVGFAGTVAVSSLAPPPASAVRWRLRTISATAGSMVLFFMVANAAWACPGYQWSGKVSSQTYWKGVEGSITLIGETVPNYTQYHILNYVDMSNFNSNCQGMGSCWIQAGNSLGFTGFAGYQYQCQSTYIEGYVEVNDVNTYGCYGYTAAQLPLAQSDFFTTYYTGTCNTNNGSGLVDAYIYNGTGWYLIGQAWIPGCALSTIYAQSEMDEFDSGNACPTINQYETFGATPDQALYQSPDGASWSLWTTSLQHGPNAPLNILPNPVTSGWNFDTWG